MPKSLVLGNGNILIGLDKKAQVRDLYFPYVGLENQAGSLYVHKIGVFVDGQFSWLEDDGWNIYINYQEDTLVSDIQCTNTNLNLRIDFNDAVYNEKNIFIRKVTVHNLAYNKRTVKLFFHQEFELYESRRGDTGYFDPVNNVIIHYKGRRTLLVNAKVADKGFDDYSVGNFRIEGKEGTYKDAEDGVLSKNPIEHGLVDSVIALTFDVEGQNRAKIYYWLLAGKLVDEVLELNSYVLEKTPEYLIGTTRDFWHAWVQKHRISFTGLDENIARLYRKSLLIMRTHVDNRGAILASGDSDILYHGKDTYSYMWPRDGALIAMALDSVGDTFVVRKFLEFCNDIVTKDGYMMHRYRADQSPASSWHPFIRDGKPELPIQEDETALVLFALWHHYSMTKDLEFIENIYNSLIKKCAQFLITHIDETTGLPKPSYDLWEEKFGISTYTSASVYAALISAARFARLLGKVESETRYLDVAKKIQAGILQYLYDEEGGYFYKMINVKDGQIEPDRTVDISSSYGVFRFGVLNVSDARLQKGMDAAKDKLTVPGDIGGIARYEGDSYFCSNGSCGNPWIITTMWLAQYQIACATSEKDLVSARNYLTWVVKHSLPSGMLPEQLNQQSGEPVSATPLTWSHAEFVMTVLMYLRKLRELLSG